jgi:hypothetical protein
MNVLNGVADGLINFTSVDEGHLEYPLAPKQSRYYPRWRATTHYPFIPCQSSTVFGFSVSFPSTMKHQHMAHQRPQVPSTKAAEQLFAHGDLLFSLYVTMHGQIG